MSAFLSLALFSYLPHGVALVALSREGVLRVAGAVGALLVLGNGITHLRAWRMARTRYQRGDARTTPARMDITLGTIGSTAGVLMMTASILWRAPAPAADRKPAPPAALESPEVRKALIERALMAKADAEARNPELEALILDDPDSDDGYIAYGEWLRRRNDPLGELIASEAMVEEATRQHTASLLLQHHLEWLGELSHGLREDVAMTAASAGFLSMRLGMSIGQPPGNMQDRARDNDQLVEAQQRAWFGALAESDGVKVWDVHLGFLRSAEITAEDAAAVAHYHALMRLPAARFLRNLTVHALTHPPIVDALVENPPRALRSLTLGGMGLEPAPTCDLTPLYPALPRLRSLTVIARPEGGVELGKIELPELLSFRLVVNEGELTTENLSSVTSAHWPKLKALALGIVAFGSESTFNTPTLSDLEPVLDARGLPSLRWLALLNVPFADELVGRLARSKVLEQLVVLELPGSLSDAGARTIVQHAQAFAHLKLLGVHMNDLSRETLTELKRALPTVKVRSEFLEADADEAPLPPGVAPIYYRLSAAEMPWGDYGAILLSGMLHDMQPDKPLELARTGPFVPPISFPFGVVVTDAFRKELEGSGLKGFQFAPVINAHIVESDWETWDRKAREPRERPEGGEPENYILGEPHSSEAAQRMGKLWQLTIDVVEKPPADRDLFRIDGSIYVTPRAQAWLQARAGEWVSMVGAASIESRSATN